MTKSSNSTMYAKNDEFVEDEIELDFDDDYGETSANYFHKKTKQDHILEWIKIGAVVVGGIVAAFIVARGVKHASKWAIRSVIAWAEKR